MFPWFNDLYNNIRNTKDLLLKKKTIKFGYNATKTTNVRQAPRTALVGEDTVLNPYDRKKLVATAQDQTRNIALVAWMFRKHLDYVSRFTFHAMTGDEKLDKALELLWEDYSRKDHCDIAGRNSLNCLIRLFESSKVVHGDAGILKLKNGMLQGIEGTKIAKPDYYKSNTVIDKSKISDHGLVLDRNGRVRYYTLVSVDKFGRKTFRQFVTPRTLLFDGYFTRFDQTRGISPLASALNTFQDLSTSWETQLIKAKMHSMFGVAIMSEGVSEGGSGFDERQASDEGVPNSTTIQEGGYEFELKPGLKLELKPNESISTIESKTPSAEFKDYTQLMMRVGMLALDIPYSLVDSSQANYSSMKQDRVEYETSTHFKREANRNVLLEIAEWKINRWVSERLIPNIVKPGMYDFRSAGRPWIEEVSEITAAQRRIDSVLSSRQREAKARGLNFFDLLKEQDVENKAMKAAGVSVVTGMPGQNIDNNNNDKNPEGE